MATAAKQIPALIICDSRGADLQWYIDQQTAHPFNIKVLTFSGKGIIDAVRSSKTIIAWRAPALLLIQNGICDVTSLDRETRLVSVAHDSCHMLVQDYYESMDIASHFVKILLDGIKNRVICSQIVGMNMARWNNQVNPHPQQDLLDMAIHDINAEINRFNSVNNVITPWLARDVHHNIKGRKSRYNRLADNRVHLTDSLKAKWAGEMVSALAKNYEKMNED